MVFQTRRDIKEFLTKMYPFSGNSPAKRSISARKLMDREDPVVLP